MTEVIVNEYSVIENKKEDKKNTYIQVSKRDTDIKNRLLDSGRRQGWDDSRK